VAALLILLENWSIRQYLRRIVDDEETEGSLAMSTMHKDDVFARDISDAALENMGGMSSAAQAACSLWSSYEACGCTC
jgi:hypothetical protein